jgi:hypothetical protein
MPQNEKPEPDIKGVTRHDYNNWKHHPVTKVFREFLQDYRGAMKARMIEQWEAGALKLSDELEARGRALAIREIIDLEFEHIATMYGLEEGTSNVTEA